jgi:PQQ-like domain
LVTVILGVLGLTACGTGRGGMSSPAGRPDSAGSSSGSSPAASRSPGLSGSNGCTTGPARQAWAMEVGPAGQVAWQVRLPTDPQQGALGPGNVYGLWQWDGSVIVLAGQVSSTPRLMSLGAATGAVRWTLTLSKRGVFGSQALTGDGGLVLTQGSSTLTMVDLATGRVRWNAAASPVDSPPLDTGSDLVYLGDAPGGRAGLVDLRSADGSVRWVATGAVSAVGHAA